MTDVALGAVAEAVALSEMLPDCLGAAPKLLVDDHNFFGLCQANFTTASSGLQVEIPDQTLSNPAKPLAEETVFRRTW